MSIGLFDGISSTEKALDATILRQNVISNNIANVDTPDFKKSEVQFENILSQAMNEGKDKNQVEKIAENTDPEVVKVNANTTMREDGNNVDVDVEMASLSKNTIQYDILIQQMNSTFKKLSTVINGGK